jgi:hypothetical protein
MDSKMVSNVPSMSRKAPRGTDLSSNALSYKQDCEGWSSQICLSGMRAGGDTLGISSGLHLTCVCPPTSPMFSEEGMWLVHGALRFKHKIMPVVQDTLIYLRRVHALYIFKVQSDHLHNSY